MPNDEKRKRRADPIAAFVDRLLGEMASLTDEEINQLFAEVAPGTDASATVYELAETVAQRSRRAQQLPAAHVQAALDATKPVRDLEAAKPSRLREIIDRALTPSLGPATDIAVAYRNKTDLTQTDKTILQHLADELKGDWTEQD